MAMKRENLPAVASEMFNHEQFGQFRYIKRDEEIWFVAVDVCRALDIQNIRQNLTEFPDDEKGVCSIYTPGGPQKVNIVSEPGFYRLIFMSRKPEAEKIKRWVFHEVLPSIRKYGFYGLLNGKQARQLTDKQYLNYLGGLDCFQYQAYLEQLTGEQRSEHYRRLEDRIDSKNMTQEEILSLANDPYIIVSKVRHGSWKASY